VKGKGFVEARHLARSDLLAVVQGRLVAVCGITISQRRVTVYNFEVANTHTYYANGWWVHNTCTPNDTPLYYRAENEFRQWLQNQGIGLKPKAGGNVGGPDAEWNLTGTDPGWKFAELKPNNADGRYDGKHQVLGRFNEGYEGPGALYVYDYDDANGFTFTLYGTFNE
jgi:hypothetical protein